MACGAASSRSDLQNHADETDPDSDKIGVVEKWEPPSILSPDCRAGPLDQVREIVSQGCYRYDFRSDEWVGYALAQILEIDLTGANGRKRMLELIDIWVENGVIRKRVASR